MKETIPYPCFEFTHAFHAVLSTSKEPEKVVKEYAEYITKALLPAFVDVEGTRTSILGFRMKEHLFPEDTPLNHPTLLLYLDLLVQVSVRLFNHLRLYGQVPVQEQSMYHLVLKDQSYLALTAHQHYKTRMLPYSDGLTCMMGVGTFNDGLPAMASLNFFEGVYLPKKYAQHIPLFSYTTQSFLAKRVEIDAGGH